jgi:ribosomal protein L40E
MPFCQIEKCGRTGLRPTEIEFDEELKKVICKTCYNDLHPTAKVAAFPVQEMYSRDVAFGLHMTSEDGIKAEVQFSHVLVQAHIPADTVKDWLGIR